MRAHTINRATLDRLETARRNALQSFSDCTRPAIHNLMELRLAMPVAYIKTKSGGFEQVEHWNWPQWAIEAEKQTLKLIDYYKEECFKEFNRMARAYGVEEIK